MTNNSRLHIYGENAATFLIFQAMALADDAIQSVLLRNLKPFKKGERLEVPKLTDTEVWLFPNFGNSYQTQHRRQVAEAVTGRV